MVRARELDDYYSGHQKPFGPLHGVVMTLKDQFNVKGYDTTLGYVGRAFKPAQDDALLVTILKELGAIIIAKTNLPQSIMWCETENPLWGLTVSPHEPRTDSRWIYWWRECSVSSMRFNSGMGHRYRWQHTYTFTYVGFVWLEAQQWPPSL